MHRSPDFNPPEKASTCTSTDDCFVAEDLKRNFAIEESRFSAEFLLLTHLLRERFVLDRDTAIDSIGIDR